jgi:phage tail-like protein
VLIERFAAEPDLVARRVRIAWTLRPESTETLADAPQQVLRRKTRDYEFVTPLPVPDPYLVYNSVAFPPPPAPGQTVTDLPAREEWLDGQLHVVEAISVANDVGGRLLERLRRTTRTVFNSDGEAVQRDVEIIDSGHAPLSLDPGVALYYQLFSPAFSALDAQSYRDIATPTAPHGLNRAMYDQLPAVHRRFDVQPHPGIVGSTSIPEAFNGNAGQLRRLLDIYGAVMDSARSTAEGLRTLHDIDRVDGRRLPLLAQWLGWRLGDVDALPLARNELKATPRLYEAVGTVAAVRALVTRYTGWTTRVAEFVQHLARANDAPQPPLRVMVETGAAWRAPLDAAAVLGFGPGNDEAFGVGALPATLTSTIVEPYALFAGAEISLAADAGPSWRVRFGAADFLDIGAATAAEVAAAINGGGGELVASVNAARVVIASRSTGTEAQVNVVGHQSEPLTIDSAGLDRPAAVIDADRVRVFGSSSPPTPDPQQGLSEQPPAGELVCKTWIGGRWRGSQRLQQTRALARGGGPARVAHPAAAVLPDGRIGLAWVDAPESALATVRLALARPRVPEPARIQGRIATRFRLFAGTQLTLRTAAGLDVFIVNAADYVSPAQATIGEVVAAMNAQLTQAVASAAPDGTLRLTSTATGPDAFLEVVLAQSTCSRALGLAHAATRTRGGWDDTLDLDAPVTMPGLQPPRATELAALAQDQGLRLSWSAFVDARWQLQGASWLGPFEIAATAAGLALRRDDGAITVLTVVQGLPSNAVRHAMVDADGALWVATSAGTARRRPNGTWMVIDAAAGLPSDNTRALVQDRRGDVWVATAAGLGRITPAGVASGLTTVNGLADNDVRAIANDADGTLWIATAAGLSHLDAALTFANVGSPTLPANDVRDVAVAGDGRVYAATAAGLAVRDTEGQWSLVTLPPAAGLDLRGVSAMRATLWVATATGAWRRTSDGTWSNFGTTQGLPSADVRRLAELADGSVALATPAGAARVDTLGRVTPWQTAQGLPSNDVAACASPWSAAVVLSDAALADREPTLVRETTGTVLLVWSRWVAGAAGEDRRALRVRRFDPATHSWSAVGIVTQPLAAGSADVQPAALPAAGGGARVFFSADRGGGPSLWEVSLSAALVPTAPLALPAGDEGHTAPLPVRRPDGTVMLVFRSDGWTAPDQLAPVLAGAPPGARSTRVPDAATLRRHAGTTTVRMSHAARNSRHRQWGDLLTCTPHRPLGRDDEPPLTPAEFFTRGTLGLYVTRGRFGQPLTTGNAARLRQLLVEFLPINLRAVIVLSPELTIEMIYGGAVDLQDSYADNYPFVDALGDPVDTWAAALPDWAVLLSNDTLSLSADQADLTTLRRRTFFFPPE